MNDPTTGAVFVIENDGDCDRIKVSLEVPGSHKIKEVTYWVTDTCTLAWESKLVDPQTEVVADPPATEELQFAADAAPAKTSSATTAAVATTSSNYIHTSQTVQDILNFDIAKLRYHTQRAWNGVRTWFRSDLFAVASSGFAWNHVVGAAIDYIGPEGLSSYSTAHGDFHSDWLWCNLNYRMDNNNKPSSSGWFGGAYTQSVTRCSGTHMTTKTWANSARNG